MTGRGEVMVWDSEAASTAGEEQRQEGASHSVEIPVEDKPLPLAEKLINGFSAGSAIYTEIRLAEDCGDFAVNLQCGKIGKGGDIALHFNPRLAAGHVVINTYDSKTATWGHEEKQPLVVMSEDGGAMRAFTQGQTVQLVIKAEASKYEMFVNGLKFAGLRHRGRGQEAVSHLVIRGAVEVHKLIYTSHTAILPPTEMYWRSLGGGHLLQVEACPQGGVVWGVAYDSSAWVYTGGWGGAHHKPAHSSHAPGSIGPMTDTKYFYIYENQRWNPLSGFSSSGLPTDRYEWSIISHK